MNPCRNKFFADENPTTELQRERIVSKFGGSSLSDSVQFEKVKKIITSDDRRSCIVVSAPGQRHPQDIKITDLLIRLYELNCRRYGGKAAQL